ncbi:amidase [Ornithinibacillus halophilus]|uniref:Amidase n=1 Tax=Ornithinibacillus halophilus TaxID=930117 RepID=A0A1M5HDJ4_9BACI|nr:amidase [Ornithinibacillus halophilus]SHG14025.1 amidase [Ornithinibacillus halophilus]
MDIGTYIAKDATELAELVRNGEVLPKELVQLSIEQLEKVNPSLNAILFTRLEKVLQEAEQMERKSSHSFFGVPILLKNISQLLKGESLTSGSKLLGDNIARHDSNFVSKLREAGFIFMGHTNTPEFGLKNISEPVAYGPTRNPWNLDYSAGGSSGGSAAAVASGIVPVAGASDGGGSIRIPASFTGLFGLKPTRGRTPVGPGVGRQWQGASIDFVLSRTVRDSAAMLDLLQTIQPEAAFQTPLFIEGYSHIIYKEFHQPLRISFTTKSPVGTPVSDDAVQAVMKTVRWLESQGHEVEEFDTPVDGVKLMQDYYVMNSGEISSLANQLEAGLGRKLTEEDVEIETWLLNVAGQSVTAAEYSTSLASWDAAAAKMANLHESFDLHITPATAYTAPKVGELTHSEENQEELRERIQVLDKMKQQDLIYEMFLPSLTYTPFTQLANLTGQPAMSIPVHVSDKGLPLGVQVMTRKGEEHRLLQLAYQMEQSSLWVGMNGNPFFETAVKYSK